MNQWITFVFIGHQMNVLRVLRGASCRRAVSVIGTARAATATSTTAFVVVRSFVRSAFNSLPFLSNNCYAFLRAFLKVYDENNNDLKYKLMSSII